MAGDATSSQGVIVIASATLIQTWAAPGAAIVVIVGGVGGLLRFVWGRIKKETGIDSLHTRLDSIEAQYRPNGGSSVRDALNRIEESQRLTRADVLRIDKAFERHLGVHEGLEARIADRSGER